MSRESELIPSAVTSIRALAARHTATTFVVDEAFADFIDGYRSLAECGMSNVIVVRSLTKFYAIPGLRVGFAVGHPALVEALERVKNSFNSYPLDRLALAGAVASVQDDAYFQESCRKVVATREALVAQMNQLGFAVLPSAANFIFARHPSCDATELASALREKAIIVRHFPKPRIDQFLRITVGTDEQCGILIEALVEILGG